MIVGGCCVECGVEKDLEVVSRFCGKGVILISDVCREYRERLVMFVVSIGKESGNKCSSSFFGVWCDFNWFFFLFGGSWLNCR